MEFKNNYFGLRHGESVPNVAGIILSHQEDGLHDKQSLTRNGELQVNDSLEEVKKKAILDNETIIYSSPFSRCKRTAEIAKDILNIKSEIIFDDRLRERWFGDWEKTSNINYEKV